MTLPYLDTRGRDSAPAATLNLSNVFIISANSIKLGVFSEIYLGTITTNYWQNVFTENGKSHF